MTKYIAIQDRTDAMDMYKMPKSLPESFRNVCPNTNHNAVCMQYIDIEKYPNISAEDAKR